MALAQYGSGIKGRNEPIEYAPGNNPFRIVSFHTDDEIYTAAAARLRASADRLSIPVHIETVSTRGSWEKNCAFKSEFIRDQWHKSDVPVVWLDADATVNAYPSLFATLDADFAVHKRDGWNFGGGTLYFGRSPPAAALLTRWVDHCQRNPTQVDDISLDDAWAEITRDMPLRTTWLPKTYRWSFDLPDADKAFIVQWKASRQARAFALSQREKTLLRKVIDLADLYGPRRLLSLARTVLWLVKHRGRRRARRASRTA